MTEVVSLTCTCGTVKGKLKVVPGSFFYVHCLCCDCQHFANHLNTQEQILDEHGATEILQTYPELMEITSGQDKIECLQLKEKGLFRWYASCCNMPLANTLASAKVPFVGIPVKLMQFANEKEKLRIIGPVTLKAFGKYAIGEMPKDAHQKFPLSYIPKIIYFMLKGRLGKKHSPSPFFRGKEPVAKIKVLSP